MTMMVGNSKTIKDLLELVEGIPLILEDFEKSGFLLTMQALQQVENSRIRGGCEKDFTAYYVEFQKVLIGLYGLVDPPEFKNNFRSVKESSIYNSDYMNWLVSEFDSHNFDLENSITNRIFFNMCMDPSYIKERQLAVDDISYAKYRANSVKEEKKMEIKKFKAKISRLSEFPRVFSFGRVTNLLESVILPLGFERTKIEKRKGRIFHKITLNDELVLWHGYDDHHEMSKGGGWPIFLGFCPPEYPYDFPEKLPSRKIRYYSMGMIPFSPVSSSYVSHLGNWENAVLGIIAHGKMLEIILKYYYEIVSSKEV